MPTYFQRPENALKRANEFIDVGKKQRALDALYDVIKSKKHRTWQKIHEPIMEKYLELCVDLKKSHVAKEGLYQYKNICQQVNVRSLEQVVRNYLKLAEEKTEAARLESQSIASEDVDIDDLDNIQTPESLLLSAVSGEDTQDRTDRLVLTPWVKFLWESYRQSLELLRNNSRVERLYHDMAQQGFRFCQKYNRKTEFRKLCENLRTHLSHVQKHQHTQTAININNQETQAMNMETRLVQLDIAINMELWQEAFKAVEDIHELMNMSKKSPKPQLLANYFQKLGLVFWKAKNHLFHACTWHKLFHLFREQKKTLTQEELKRMATRVMLATLAIPIPPSQNLVERYLPDDDNSLADKHRKLSTLLDLPQPPTRAGLIKDLVKYNVIQFAAPQLQDLYRWLEVDFHPLQLCERVATCLHFVRESEETDLHQYITAIEDISVMRLLKQVSQVYQTIKFSRVCELVSFATPFRIERIVVEAAKTCDLQVLQQNRPQSKSDLQVRIDHRTRSLSFGTDLVVSQREDVPEGPNLQCMPSEHIRNQLTAMASALHEAISRIQPQDQTEDLRSQIVKMVQNTTKNYHRRILDRRTIIERRKEILEEITIQKEYEEQSKKEEEARKLYEAEMARLEREAEERKRQRIIQERKQIEMSQVKMRLEQLKKSGRTLDIDEEELEKMDPDELMQKQVEQLDKEKKELMARLKNQEKKVDHFARACRVEEIPLLDEQFREQSVNDRAFWEQQEEDRIETLKSERELALKHGSRLMRMMEDKNQFVAELTKARQSVFKDRLRDFEKMLAAEKVKRLNERKERRKAERKLKRQKEKEEAKHRAEEERKLLEEKEKARRVEEAKAKERAEYEARLAKIEEQTEKQKQREREVEERLAQEQRQAEGRLEKDRPGEPWRPLRAGGWREREKQKEESWRRPRDDDYERRDDTFARRLGDDRGPGGKHDNERIVDGERERDDSWSRRVDGTAPDRPGYRVDDSRGPPPRRLDNDRGPPPRRLDDDRGPPPRRLDDDRGPPPRRLDDDRGPPPRHLDDDRGPPPRRLDDDKGPAPRRFDDDRGPPPRRLDDDRSPLPRRLNDDRGPAPRQLDDDRGPPPRRFDDDRGPPPRRFDDDRGPPPRRLDDDRGPPPRRFDDNRGPPPRRFDDDRGAPPRRVDDDRGPPPRRFDDDRGPPPRRLDDERGPPPRGRFPDERDSPRRYDDDRRLPPRRFEDDRGPRRFDDERGPRRVDDGRQPRRYEDDRGPPRRYDDDRRGPPSRRFDDDRAPPPRRLDDDRGLRRPDDRDRRGFDDRDVPRRGFEDQGSWRRGGDREDDWRGGPPRSRDSRGADWRKDGPPRDLPPRDDRGPYRDGGDPGLRRDSPRPRDDGERSREDIGRRAPPRDVGRDSGGKFEDAGHKNDGAAADDDDEGWVTVKR